MSLTYFYCKGSTISVVLPLFIKVLMNNNDRHLLLESPVVANYPPLRRLIAVKIKICGLDLLVGLVTKRDLTDCLLCSKS